MSLSKLVLCSAFALMVCIARPSFALASELPDDLSKMPLITSDKIDGFVKKFSMGEPVGDSFFFDLNDDELPEKFIGTNCGHAGCTYYVFSPQNLDTQAFRFIGMLNLTRNFEMTDVSHEGFHDLIDFWALSAESGDLNRISYSTQKHGYDFIYSKPAPMSVAGVLHPSFVSSHEGSHDH